MRISVDQWYISPNTLSEANLFGTQEIPLSPQIKRNGIPYVYQTEYIQMIEILALFTVLKEAAL